jgi:hypothetical protein
MSIRLITGLAVGAALIAGLVLLVIYAAGGSGGGSGY